jgi:predicted helicase
MTRPSAQISPAHPLIREYQRSLADLRGQGVEHELGLRRPFENLLADSARLHGWRFVAEVGAKAGGHRIRPDGTVFDANSLPRGFWESKDSHDDLDREIDRKIRLGYPVGNTIFEDTRRGVLYQNRSPVMEADLSNTRDLADLLFRFYSHTEPEIREFEVAVEEFGQRVPDLARGLALKIEEAHKHNRPFQEAFAKFFALCQASLNPNISRAAVDEMLVQHLLTERFFRTIFDNPEFTRRNAIAAEVERVIEALVSQSFSRTDYLKSLDSFYIAIESAARTIADFSEKQMFLNSIYERFFRGYSVKVADTHGIVYTPPQIVDYMCGAVEDALKREFGLTLSSPGVVILDPCTGTGNFIVHLMQRLSKRDLPRVYKEQLFANEVMLMPYYIAALNIEHAYLELSGQYEPFDGLCFVDTLDLAEDRQLPMFSEANTERVDRERKAQITVIIGNPPYNVGQLNENDNNKNRKYPVIDRRIHDTYAKDSKATNKNALSDAYVKFFRWATDRLGGRDGVVCFVSNSGFVHGVSFDGLRRHLAQDFQRIYHFDFRGNARTAGERRRREGGNIFRDQIRVGVGITVLIRNAHPGRTQIRYHNVADYWRAEEKTSYLASFSGIADVPWRVLTPDSNHTWLVPEHAIEFSVFAPIDGIFAMHSRGVVTCRDAVVYDFKTGLLADRVKAFIEDYNAEVDRYRRAGKESQIDDFVRYDRVKWSRDLKLDLQRQNYAEYAPDKARASIYRPFTQKTLFFDRILNEEVYRNFLFFPRPSSENHMICVPGPGNRKGFGCLLVRTIPALDLAFEKIQCFPFYTYSPDGSNRRENITDAALEKFRQHYANPAIAKWDIFHYIYSVLHHPAYREKFADNLKRELPRIPFAPDFAAFAAAGRDLARLHVEYETLEPWPLEWIENPALPQSYRVEDKMRLNKDKTALTVNPSLTLAGIPPETFEYRLGNRSALEWVVDQYRVTEDDRSGIQSDPNREDDPQYIVRLVGQVVRVGIETVRIVRSLPPVFPG